MIDKISEEQRADYLDAFNMFDNNREGTITAEKLGNLMRKLNQNPTDEDLKDMISIVDKKGDGKIDFEEFVTMMEKRKEEADTEQEIINAFRVFDKDGNGLISKAELTNIMSILGDTLRQEEIEEMIIEADVDGDGFINYEEFVRMMMAK